MREVTGAEPDVAALLNPRSIAVVGASSRPGTLSWWPLHLLVENGFRGGVYPINPAREEIGGVRCYRALGDLPEPVDVAIVALDAERSLQAVAECEATGVGAVVLPTHGFGEIGEAGRERQEQLAGVRERGKLRIVGPNTDGIANVATGAIASIQPLFGEGIRSGPVAVATQSGATAGSLMVRLKREGIGCRFYASAGNEADLGLADFMSVMVQDPEVRIVLSFVESIRRPEDFLAVAALAAELEKPIALIKVGRTESGARRAAAHTGALAGTDELYDALFREYGLIRVGELGELVAVAKLFLGQGAPRSRGLGILSVSGGQAGAIADQASTLGLTVPAISPATEARLDTILEFGSGFNPCDLTGAVATDHALASRVYTAFDEEPDVATVVYARKALTGEAAVAAAAHLAEASDRPGATPVAVYAMDGAVAGEEARSYERAHIPVFASIAELSAAVGGLADWRTRRRRLGERGDGVGRPVGAGPVGAGPVGALEAVGGVVTAPATSRLLQAYGIPTPAHELVADAPAAVRAAERIGFPVVLKVVSDRIPHKTEAGGVVIGLGDAAAVSAAHERIRASAQRFLGNGGQPDGVLVQEQVTGGVEVIVGAKVDPAFGAFVLVGIGGVLAELLADAVVRPAPVTPDDALEMVDELRGGALLHGYRGAPPADLPALARLVSRFSSLAADHAGVLREADLNPVIVLPAGRGVRVVDSLLIVEAGPPPASAAGASS